MASGLSLEDKSLVMLHAELLSGLVFTDEVIAYVFEMVEKMLNLQESAGYRRIYRMGEEKGEVKGAKKTVRQFLATRFGEQSSDMQDKIQQLTDLALLSEVLPRIFSANTLEDARSIINEILPESPGAKKVAKS